MPRSLANPALEVLVFEIGGQQHAFPAAAIKELVPMVAFAPLPEHLTFIEGIINYRGAIVPLLDFRARLGLPTRPAVPSDHLIVAWAGERLAAVRVDRVMALVKLSANQVEAAERIATGLDSAVWVAQLPDRLVLVHDLHALLPRTEAARLAPVLAPADSEGG
jgi:purine-binding chemotaxis protein CheW